MKDKRFVSLRPRLAVAAGFLKDAHTIADIGSDHGRLAVGLLQQGIASRVIATDISAASLEKARLLAQITGRAPQIAFRVGSGLHVLRPGEADAIALCGMGGALIAQLLEEAKTPLMGARLAVMQPMRGVSQLRAYLFHAGYRVMEDSIALDQGRYYQVFSAALGREALPAHWPQGCFLIGPRACENPLFLPYIDHMTRQARLRLEDARGSRGEQALRDTIHKLTAARAFAQRG